MSSIPMPGALRLRALHPLRDADGSSCSLIYDLERAAVLEVPAELQLYLAEALERGNWDEDLLSWLVGEDLITAEGWAGWSQGATGATAPDAGWWSLEKVCRIEDEVHARIDQTAPEDVLAVLELAFKQGFGAARIRLHLDWRTGFPGIGLLEWILVETSRLSRVARQEIAFELTLEPAEVTPILARALVGYPFHVRLRCGAFAAPGDGAAPAAAWRNQEVDDGVRLLLAYGLAERLTLHCVLADDANLGDLWSWAKRAGIRHLDAVRLEANGTESLDRTRQFREDLLVVADEMGGDLEAQTMPIDFQPLTRIIRRLMRSEPMARFEEQPGPAPGLIAVADSYALPGVEKLAPRLLLPDIWIGGVEEWESEALGTDLEVEEVDFPCRSCWARYVCSHSSLASSALEGDDARQPSEARCAIWRDEAEAALRLYHRMAHADPVQVLRLFKEATAVSSPPLGLEGWDDVKPS